MEIVVIWTDSAKKELQNIYDYYCYKASRKIADKISNSIVDRTINLAQTPRMGRKEDLLNNLNKEIRYLVDGNYKIVYWIEENLVFIASVFDCRQNPKKMGNKKI